MNIRKLLERLYVLPYKLQQVIGLFILVILCGAIYGVIALVKLSIMSDSDDILVVMMLVVAFTSLVVASSESGYIVGYGVSFRDKYTINKAAFGGYCRVLVLVILGLATIGLLLAQDIVSLLEFTVINAAFIGYALAWKKLVKKLK